MGVTVMRHELSFSAPDGTELIGELTTPDAGPRPAVLILNGSGPLDRDSAMPGQQLGFADALADELAASGMGSLRYDKRGVGSSGGDYLSMGLHTEMQDAAAALAALRERPEVDRQHIGIAGHSIGALIAAHLAAQDPAVDAIVLLAGPAQNGRSTIAWQQDRLAASLPGPAWLLPRISRTAHRYGLRRIERSTEDTVRVVVAPQPAKWMREFLAYDPEHDLRQVECGVLALTGRKDLQVDPDDVARIGGLVAGRFQGANPADLTHLLRTEPGPAGILSYRPQLTRPVDGVVLRQVSDWLAAELAISQIPTAEDG